MFRFICLVITLVLAVSSYAIAKYESESVDAGSVVVYGEGPSGIVPLAVDADGYVYTSGGSADLTAVTTDILCSTDGDCDVGSAANSMGDIHADGTIYVNGSIDLLGLGTSFFSGGLLSIGTGTPNTIDSGIGDLYVTDALEVDGNIYSAGNISVDHNGTVDNAVASKTISVHRVAAEGTNSLTMGIDSSEVVYLLGGHGGSNTFANLDIDTSGTGTISINDNGGANDFRVEGDTDVNLIFSDASADNVGIGTSAPLAKLHVTGEAKVTGVSGDGTGKAVCIKADGNFGSCGDTVGAGGTCTCN